MNLQHTNLLLVDGNWFLHRAYNVAQKYSSSPETKIPSLVLGWISEDAMALKAKAVVVCFDGDHPFRYSLYPKYKERRGNISTDADYDEDDIDESGVYAYLPRTLELLQRTRVSFFQLDEFEADDLIAGFAARFKSIFRSVYIDSIDKDLMQLVGDNVHVYQPKTGKRDIRIIDANGVKELKGLSPNQWLDYQTLTGDSTDSIPSVGKIGDKTARKILQEHGSLAAYFKTDLGSQFWQKFSTELSRNRSLVRLEKKAADNINVSALHLIVGKADVAKIERELNVRLPRSYHDLQSFVNTRETNLFKR